MNTRQAILEYLDKYPAACAEELAQACSRTRANIQYHLTRMERAGTLVRLQNRPIQDEPGRPRIYFAISPLQKPDNLAQLSKVLLKSYLDLALPAIERNERMETIARTILPPRPVDSSFTVRLNYLVKQLSKLGYQARWEARSSGPEVVFRNCPYAAILEDYPDICKIDVRILSIYLDKNAKQTERIKSPDIPTCRFRLS